MQILSYAGKLAEKCFCMPSLVVRNVLFPCLPCMLPQKEPDKRAEANLSAHNANYPLSVHAHVGLPNEMPALCLADWDCTHVS